MRVLVAALFRLFRQSGHERQSMNGLLVTYSDHTLFVLGRRHYLN